MNDPEDPPPPGHMTPDAFRRLGYQAVDWVARYMEEVAQKPVLSAVAPGELRAQLPAQAPEEGEPFDAVLADMDRLIMPGITHWQSPNFFAYFPANASGPAILGELLSAGLGVQGMLWATSPACTELESHVLDWLVDLMDLPSAFLSTGTGGGVIQDSASSATLCALLTARERVTGYQTNERGLDGGLVGYCSREAHSSFQKAARIIGIGAENLRAIETDDEQAMCPTALRAAIAVDRAAGRTPFFVGATVGTTSTTAVDPIPTLADICAQEDLWLHVDAAYAGPAALCPELRPIFAGVDRADSYCFNAHKWMLTNFDCNCFYVADREPLLRTLSILPEYLKNQATASGAVIDYRDWQVPLGRRFRALKLWMVIRHYGAEGLRRQIRRHVAWAARLVAQIENHPDFELVAPAPLSLVCFRHRAGDAVSRGILEALNASGRQYLTHTKVNGAYTLRLAIGSSQTEWAHVVAAWKAATSEGARLTAG